MNAQLLQYFIGDAVTEFIAQWYLNYTLYGSLGISWLILLNVRRSSTSELFVLNLCAIDSETLSVRWGTELEVTTEIAVCSHLILPVLMSSYAVRHYKVEGVVSMLSCLCVQVSTVTMAQPPGHFGYRIVWAMNQDQYLLVPWLTSCSLVDLSH